jgi:hypothetical protein
MTDDTSLARIRIGQLASEYQRVVQKARTAERQRLEGFRAKLSALEQQYDQVKPASPKPITIPAIFGRQHDENFISDYLAYVLDPAENGIGEAPLAQLLHLCGIEAGDLPLEEVMIHREYQLENGRIDLLLEWEDMLVLGIENKILSAEGTGQTRYYAKVVPRLFEGTPYHLVYLTRDGHKAGSSKFQSISYAQLLAALRNVAVTSATSSRQRFLWDDFLEHLEVYIIMSDPDHFEFSEKSKLYIEHQTMLHDLENTFKKEWNEALAYIEQQLYTHLKGGPWITRFYGTKYNFHQVLKPSWDLAGLSIHYEYWFTVARLNRRELTFMVDVESKRADEFLARFDSHYPSIETKYRERGIRYRPRNRKFAIAWKAYPITQDIDQVARTFIDAFTEFRFLEKEIDAILAELVEE